MTHEEILSMLGDYVDYLIANSSAEAPMWNIEKEMCIRDRCLPDQLELAVQLF